MKVTTPANDINTIKQDNLAGLLIDRNIDAVIAINNEYTIIAWNNTASVIYHVPKKAAESESLFDIIPALKTDDEITKAIEQALKGNKTFVPASKNFKHRQHTENHFIPLNDNDGNIIGVMNIVHDVAHRIKAEQQLQQLNEELETRYRQLQITSEELATFTYFASNKIKEPIRHIYTGIEHLIKVEAGKLSDSGKASFRRIQSSLNRMDLLLDDILNLSQISILQKPQTAVNLNAIINEAGNMVKEATDKEANIVAEKLPTIPGHKNYLHTLFYNLLDNAVKFNDNAKPQIKILCEKVVLNNEFAQQYTEPEYYKITITDDGIGFNNDDAKKIFMMFEKLHDKKYKGSGTGLAVAQKIMNAHNGFITAQSEAGKGSSFYCFFPADIPELSGKK